MGRKLRQGAPATHPHTVNDLRQPDPGFLVFSPVVSVISQDGQNQPFPAAINPEAKALEPIRPRTRHGQNSMRKSQAAGLNVYCVWSRLSLGRY
jgi:hypothetical protein